MNTLNILSDEWNSLREAEESLLVSRYNIRRIDDFMVIILLALGTLSEQATALRFFKNDEAGLEDAELIRIIPDLIDIAVDGNKENRDIARSVLIRYSSHFLGKRQLLKDALERLLNRYLIRKDEKVYRRLAELLVDMHYPEFLKKLILTCKKEHHENISKIYRDFFKFIP
ncbi:hypothetical protein [Chryseobacterium sp.]|uniref:hypothetical protein n=1 Tax=Chryseobacterium sp. TaxID=1871047 RepID=UPI0026242118|nr:hypothetical protein [Chryseobacterium sp.]